MLNLLLKLRALNAFLKKNLARFCALIMFLLVFIVLLGVATRYLYGQQAKFTDESARMLLIWLSFFGGALAFAAKSHIGLDFLLSKFEDSARRFASVIALLISIFFSLAILLGGGISLVLTSYESGNYLVSVPIAMWCIYLCVPICGVISAMFLCEDLLSLLLENSKGEGGK